MIENKTEAHWDVIYQAKDDSNLTWFQERAEPSIGLIQRHAQSESASIVDIGAGSSRLVDGLLREGYSNITLVDISRSALDRTATRLGERGKQVVFIQADLTEWKPDSIADVWHDRAVFHFLTNPDDQDSYLAALDAGTTSGSIVIIGTFAPDAPENCSGLAVRRYSAEELGARLGDDFELLEKLRHVHLTPAGKEQPFTFAVFRRR